MLSSWSEPFFWPLRAGDTGLVGVGTGSVSLHTILCRAYGALYENCHEAGHHGQGDRSKLDGEGERGQGCCEWHHKHSATAGSTLTEGLVWCSTVSLSKGLSTCIDALVSMIEGQGSKEFGATAIAGLLWPLSCSVIKAACYLFLLHVHYPLLLQIAVVLQRTRRLQAGIAELHSSICVVR